jgi:hypothetical protein
MGRVSVVRRFFWFSVGAASAVWVTRRGEAALREVQERGVLGTVDVLADKATRLVGQIDSLARSTRMSTPRTQPTTQATQATPQTTEEEF